MIIKIFDKEYNMRPNMVKAGSNIVKDLLSKVKATSDARNLPQLYTAVIIMMYVLSTSALMSLSVEEINTVIDNNKAEK